MTDIRSPDTAVKAAAEQLCLLRAHEAHFTSGVGYCNSCLEAADLALAAALPHLGEIRTERVIRSRVGETWPVQNGERITDRDLCDQGDQLLHRTVITTPWKEHTDE